MAENIGFEPMIEVSLLMTTLYVGKVGVEPTCNQLLFLLLIRERRYNPIKVIQLPSHPILLRLKPLGNLFLYAHLIPNLRQESVV